MTVPIGTISAIEQVARERCGLALIHGNFGIWFGISDDKLTGRPHVSTTLDNVLAVEFDVKCC